MRGLHLDPRCRREATAREIDRDSALQSRREKEFPVDRDRVVYGPKSRYLVCSHLSGSGVLAEYFELLHLFNAIAHASTARARRAYSTRWSTDFFRRLSISTGLGPNQTDVCGAVDHLLRFALSFALCPSDLASAAASLAKRRVQRQAPSLWRSGAWPVLSTAERRWHRSQRD